MLLCLLAQIEEIRARLNDLAEKNELTHPEVLRLSQELDSLLNRYYLMLGTIKKQE